MLYSGDEIGQLNDYSYKDDPEKACYIHRGIPGTLQNELFPALRRIEEARRSHSVFDAGVPFHTIDTQNQAVLGLVRENESEALLHPFAGAGICTPTWKDNKTRHFCVSRRQMLFEP